MKKIITQCGVALFFIASMNTQADIQPMNDEDLSEVEGQLGLIDTTRFIAGAHVAGAYVAHEVVETGVRLAVAHEVVETGARLAVAHEVAEAGFRLKIAKAGVRLKIAHEVVETGARLAGAFVINEAIDHYPVGGSTP